MSYLLGFAAVAVLAIVAMVLTELWRRVDALDRAMRFTPPHAYLSSSEGRKPTTWYATEQSAYSPCEDCSARMVGEPVPRFRQGNCCLSPGRVQAREYQPTDFNAD